MATGRSLIVLTEDFVRGARLLGVARLLLVGTVVAGCGAIGGNPPAGQNPGGGRPATTVTVAKATNGPISQVIGFTGSVQAADTVNVVPVISGRITKLNVDVGSTVKAGDLIAELDKSTLNAQVGQAQAGVDAANVKLSQIQAGARPESVAAAQSNAQAAQAKLDAIKAGARPETAGAAKANLDSARAKLAAIENGARPESDAVAKANLDAAKANLDRAKAQLQQLLDGPTPDQVVSSQLSLEHAKNAVVSSQANRDGQCNPKNPGFVCETAQDRKSTRLNSSHSSISYAVF